LPAEAEPVLPALVRRVVERYVGAFAPERIVLFGSWAKGVRRPDSDVDLLVVTEAAAGGAAPRVRARQLAGDCFPGVDVILATPAEVAAAPAAASPFLASILGSGIELYPRRPPSARAEPGPQPGSGGKSRPASTSS
jgi:predicted nucleotidyltransferase